MRPDPEYSNQVAEKEQRLLEERVKALTDADKKEIAEQGRQLAESQDKVEDLSCLPTLHLGDISPKMKRTVLDHTGVSNIPVQWRTTATNGITYFRAISTLASLSEDLEVYLPLFCDVGPNMWQQQNTWCSREAGAVFFGYTFTKHGRDWWWNSVVHGRTPCFHHCVYESFRYVHKESFIVNSKMVLTKSVSRYWPCRTGHCTDRQLPGSQHWQDVRYICKNCTRNELWWCGQASNTHYWSKLGNGVDVRMHSAKHCCKMGCRTHRLWSIRSQTLVTFLQELMQDHRSRLECTTLRF